MSKAIKVRDDIYTKLDEMRDQRTTFSDVISVLLKVYETIKTTSDILGPGHFLKGNAPPARDIFREAQLERADLEARRLK